MTVTILQGDCREVLKTLAEKTVQTCVTSPPYYGLRDYSTANWTGGDPDCDHIQKIAAHGGDRADRDQTANIFYYKNKCGKCGAKREDNQIGLEDSPDEYVQKLVGLFREVRRVLRDDGTLWLNLGDSYNNFRTSMGPAQSVHVGKLNGKPAPESKKRGWDGLKEKDLIGIPWRVAFALQADGWYLRQDIVWTKENPMPESVRDRCTKAHEYIFLMSKKPHYYFDHEAIKEPVKTNTKKSNGEYYETRNKRSVWNVPTRPYKEAHFACVDVDTEALTPTGWKKHDELIDGDIIAAYDKEHDCIVWKPATFHRYDYDGEMINIDKRNTHQLLTPNHRCLIKRRSGGTDVVLAENLKPSMNILLSAPFVINKTSGVGKNIAALLGWYVTEGYKKSEKSIQIYQSLSANSHKVAQIRKILTELGASWKEITRERIINNKKSVEVTFTITGTVAKELLMLCPNKEKMPNWEWINWPEDDIKAFVDAVIDGDGHRRLDGRSSIIQKNSLFLDILQVMLLTLGKVCKISKRKNSSCHTAFITTDRWLTLRSSNGKHTQLSRVNYKNIVWCPSVSTTFWLARRHGKTFITGNTFPPDLIEPCILAGCPKGGMVLDPFGGSGTTGMVSDLLGRDATLIELNPAYIKIAENRIEQANPSLDKDLFKFE